MSTFLERLTQEGEAFADSISGLAAQVKNVDFKDALLAICALVAAADGEIQKEEREAAANVIRKNAALKNYPPAALAQQFTLLCRDALDSVSKLDVELVVGKLRGKADQADLAVKLAIIIAQSKGGVLVEVEKKVLRQIVKKLSLDATDYGL
jgi:tellurite resistance protein TerB